MIDTQFMILSRRMNSCISPKLKSIRYPSAPLTGKKASSLEQYCSDSRSNFEHTSGISVINCRIDENVVYGLQVKKKRE